MTYFLWHRDKAITEQENNELRQQLQGMWEYIQALEPQYQTPRQQAGSGDHTTGIKLDDHQDSES
ncbi:hypothetical protein N7481_011905 [Penicillium waksmanii]|uniref:uncharacterized protein n=1 Tax=Penicillium waksmanii TaxID=69791 RepID=UPI0025470355|nr:uncharacterized protein N7481_011905 [Penicillium waksmanii]KAJ5974695.1 hypothetical protein N7481_011905 [Penicillium waksmanii]